MSCFASIFLIPEVQGLSSEQPRSVACWALANGRISTGSEVNINTICSWETKASCQTLLGPAASGTCFVIFTIGLAMFTLLKSFQIIKNRKTFKHYCFSALQGAGGGRKKRTLFQREQVECQGRGRQGDICCLVQIYQVMPPPILICLSLLNHSALLLPSGSWFSPLLTSPTKTGKLIFAYFPVFRLLHSDKLSGLEEIFWTSDIERA